MTSASGHKRSQHLIEGEAYRRIMSRELPGTVDEFALRPLTWFRQTHPDAPLITPEMIENQCRETWRRRHELIRGELIGEAFTENRTAASAVQVWQRPK